MSISSASSSSLAEMQWLRQSQQATSGTAQSTASSFLSPTSASPISSSPISTSMGPVTGSTLDPASGDVLTTLLQYQPGTSAATGTATTTTAATPSTLQTDLANLTAAIQSLEGATPGNATPGATTGTTTTTASDAGGTDAVHHHGHHHHGEQPVGQDPLTDPTPTASTGGTPGSTAVTSAFAAQLQAYTAQGTAPDSATTSLLA